MVQTEGNAGAPQRVIYRMVQKKQGDEGMTFEDSYMNPQRQINGAIFIGFYDLFFNTNYHIT